MPFLKKAAYASEVTFAQPAPPRGGLRHCGHPCGPDLHALAELVDLEKEKARMEKELKKNSDELQKLNTKLANPGFVNKAPEHVVKAGAGSGREAHRAGGQAGGAAQDHVIRHRSCERRRIRENNLTSRTAGDRGPASASF